MGGEWWILFKSNIFRGLRGFFLYGKELEGEGKTGRHPGCWGMKTGGFGRKARGSGGTTAGSVRKTPCFGGKSRFFCGSTGGLVGTEEGGSRWSGSVGWTAHFLSGASRWSRLRSSHWPVARRETLQSGLGRGRRGCFVIPRPGRCCHRVGESDRPHCRGSCRVQPNGVPVAAMPVDARSAGCPSGR